METPALDFRKPHVLRNDKEYRAAVREIDALLDADPAPGTDSYDRLEFLSVLVAAYEDEHEPPIPEAAPQEVVLFALEQQGREPELLLLKPSTAGPATRGRRRAQS